MEAAFLRPARYLAVDKLARTRLMELGFSYSRRDPKANSYHLVHPNNQSLKGVLFRATDGKYRDRAVALLPDHSSIATFIGSHWLSKDDAGCILRKFSTPIGKLQWFGLATMVFTLIMPTPRPSFQRICDSRGLVCDRGVEKLHLALRR